MVYFIQIQINPAFLCDILFVNVKGVVNDNLSYLSVSKRVFKNETWIKYSRSNAKGAEI